MISKTTITSGLSDLPVEILETIFSFLTPKALCAISKTSHLFANLAISPPVLKQVFSYLNHSPSQLLKVFFQATSQCSQKEARYGIAYSKWGRHGIRLFTPLKRPRIISPPPLFKNAKLANTFMTDKFVFASVSKSDKPYLLFANIKSDTHKMDVIPLSKPGRFHQVAYKILYPHSKKQTTVSIFDLNTEKKSEFRSKLFTVTESYLLESSAHICCTQDVLYRLDSNEFQSRWFGPPGMDLPQSFSVMNLNQLTILDFSQQKPLPQIRKFKLEHTVKQMFRVLSYKQYLMVYTINYEECVLYDVSNLIKNYQKNSSSLEVENKYELRFFLNRKWMQNLSLNAFGATDKILIHAGKLLSQKTTPASYRFILQDRKTKKLLRSVRFQPASPMLRPHHLVKFLDLLATCSKKT